MVLTTVLVSACFNPGDDAADTEAATGSSTAGDDAPTGVGDDGTPTGPDDGTPDDGPDDGPDGTTTDGGPDDGPDDGMVDDTTTDDGPDDTTTDDGPDDTTGDPATCDAPAQCVQTVPEDWDGPFAMEDGEGASCAGTYPNEDSVVFEGLTAPPANCACSCGAAEDLNCAGSVPLARYIDSPMCIGAPTNNFEIIQDCTSLNILGLTGAWEAEGGFTPTGGSCDPTTTETLPDLQWDTTATLCTGAVVTEAGCGADQVCAPPAPEGFPAALCITHDGDVACPEGEYSDRQVLFAGAQDLRECNACTCADPSGGSCGGEIELYGQSNCINMTNTLDVDALECVNQGATFVRSATYVPDPSATCAASVGSATGTATPQGAVTVCCN